MMFEKIGNFFRNFKQFSYLAVFQPIKRFWQNHRLAEPWSTWTALVYVVLGVGFVLTFGTSKAILFGSTMVGLGVGTAWMHSQSKDDRELERTVDHAFIHAVFSVLLLNAIGAPFWLMLAGAGAATYILEAELNLPLRPLVGIYLSLMLVASIINGTFLTFLAGFGFLAVAFYIERFGGDFWHGMWHLVTAPGIVILFFL